MTTDSQQASYVIPGPRGIIRGHPDIQQGHRGLAVAQHRSDSGEVHQTGAQRRQS